MKRSSLFVRALTLTLCVTQLSLGIPAMAQVQSAPQESPKAEAPPTPAPEVRANRTVPNVAKLATELELPAFPSNADLMRARIFSEPLVPMPRETSREENAALARAIMQYNDGKRSDMVAPLTTFLARYPFSAWRPSLLANMGTVYRAHGYLSRAFDAWTQAWDEAKGETDPRTKAMADFALGELLELSGKVGKSENLAVRLGEIEGRNMSGHAAQNVAMAREALWVLTNHHERATSSGAVALQALLAAHADAAQRTAPPHSDLRHYHTKPAGMSLSELRVMASRIGLSYEMVVRPGTVAIPVPSIVHFRIGHYSAIIKAEGGRYLMLDPILGGTLWVSRDTIDQESSGYFLVPSNAVNGWRVASAKEAATVIGHCAPGAPDDGDPGPPCGCGSGMPVYSFHPMQASLRLSDTPLQGTTTRGPAALFQLTYNQRDPSQPQTFTSVNVGPQWTIDWLSWISDHPNSADVSAKVALRGGGIEHYTTGVSTGTYPPFWRTRASVVKVSANPIRYERRLRDGGVEVFAQSNGVIASNRKVYLTEVIDPQGLSLTFTYDASLRLVAVTDANGLVSTLAYDLASDPLKITKVTDPYGRFATLTYNADGQLASITDVLGLTSSFAYTSGDFIWSMTTPYGTTRFWHESGAATRFVQATDPLGGTERLEYRWSTTDLPATAPANQVPTGFSSFNDDLDRYNSVYWDKRAIAFYPDVSKATVTHWLMEQKMTYAPILYSHGFATSVPHSIKRPLETRVWFAYKNQGATGWIGSWIEPTKTARVLDDGTSQISQVTYNDQGSVTSTTDPLGRRTSYTYATNGIDLLERRQTTGSLNDLLTSYSNYNAQHVAQSTVDAAGQASTSTYNGFGQVLTSTNANGETTTFAYDADGRVETITAPLAGAVITYAYTAYGQVSSVTQPDGYVVTTAYDSFDRPTQVTYPDGTTEGLAYDRLDLATKTDRLGRTTRFFYDRLRRLLVTRDPQGRTVTQQWCTCGSLDKLIDAKGEATTWQRDLQSRVTREVRADGTTATDYVYETTTNRLKTVTDPKGQVTTHTYLADDRVSDTAYTNAVIASSGVTYTYDAAYARVTTMGDGTGTTSYTYHPPATLGAGHEATIDGPLTNDTIAYTYDELGRRTTRAINGAANSVAWVFDSLWRLTSETNVLGNFTYAYDGVTQRLASTAYPNGQTSSYMYFPTSQDHRLQTIHHKYPNTATMSKFDYTFDAMGNILTWRQQADSTAVVWAYGYDAANQLTSADQWSTAASPAILKRYGYGYDAAGNRTHEQIDDQVTQATHDSMNRTLTQSSGGALTFAGALNEPATVSVQGRPAIVDSTNKFRGTASVAAGSNTPTIVATDASGNTTTQQYQVNQVEAAKTLTYDANGNLTADGTRTFEWDARNQLVAVTLGMHRSEFTYDGLQRRVREVEKESSIVQSDIRVLWCDTVICEARGADGVTVTRRAFIHGEQVGGSARFFTTDHLGSITDVADTSVTLLGRYAYDPWGRRTVTAGVDVTSEGFTGHRWHSGDSLSLALYRAYDSDLGIWISEDPMGLSEGPNFSRYVAGNPIRYQDPLGLAINWTVSKLNQQLVGGKCPTGAGACTDPMFKHSATGCTQAACGKWSFTATVDMTYSVRYIQNKYARAVDGRTYEVHEWLHIGDYQEWCSTTLSAKYPTQGFDSESDCNVARVRFLSGVPADFLDASNKTRANRDKK